MKEFHILKAFKGSNCGLECHDFVKGSRTFLSDSLAGIALKEGWVKPVEAPKAKPPEEPVSDSLPDLIENRETKVVAPEETKPEPSRRFKKQF